MIKTKNMKESNCSRYQAEGMSMRAKIELTEEQIQAYMVRREIDKGMTDQELLNSLLTPEQSIVFKKYFEKGEETK